MTEEEETFIEDLENPHWLKDGDSFIWQSERSGWRHIYEVSRDGQTFTNLTPGEFDVIERRRSSRRTPVDQAAPHPSTDRGHHDAGGTSVPDVGVDPTACELVGEQMAEGIVPALAHEAGASTGLGVDGRDIGRRPASNTGRTYEGVGAAHRVGAQLDEDLLEQVADRQQHGRRMYSGGCDGGGSGVAGTG